MAIKVKLRNMDYTDTTLSNIADDVANKVVIRRNGKFYVYSGYKGEGEDRVVVFLEVGAPFDLVG